MLNQNLGNCSETFHEVEALIFSENYYVKKYLCKYLVSHNITNNCNHRVAPVNEERGPDDPENDAQNRHAASQSKLTATLFTTIRILLSI